VPPPASRASLKPRRGAGAVERGGLENRYRVKPIQGSNPCPAAGFPPTTRDFGRYEAAVSVGRDRLRSAYVDNGWPKTGPHAQRETARRAASLRVVGKRDDEADQPPVLVVEDASK
jgi:hypothetical protein